MKQKNVKKKIKSKKGASMVEFTMVCMIFLTVFSVGFDFVMLGYKYMSVSNYANDLVRTLTVQGGAASSTPKGFQGGSAAYKTLSEIKTERNNFAKTIGATSSDVKVYVAYTDSSNTRVEKNINSISTFTMNYLSPFEVIVEYTPKLEILSNFNVSLKGNIKRIKVGVSEYVQNSEYD